MKKRVLLHLAMLASAVAVFTATAIAKLSPAPETLPVTKITAQAD